MRSRRKSANTGKLGRRARQGAGCVAALCLLLATGCAGTNPHAKGDPLVGDIHPSAGSAHPGVPHNPPSHTQNPNASPNLPSHTQNPGMLPPPTTQGPVTNAALASRPSGRRLAIGDRVPPNGPGSQPANSGGQPASFVAPAGRSANPKVVALPRNAGLPGVASTGSFNTNQQTVDILQSQLRARGVLFQKQDTVPEGIKFSCLVPCPTNPDSSQLYEAIARDYVTAVQAVLVQIDQQRK